MTKRETETAAKAGPLMVRLDAEILDCIDDRAKTFYQRWDFAELPGHPYRLFLSWQMLAAMMARS